MKRFNPFKIYQAAKKPKIPKKSEEVVNEESDDEVVIIQDAEILDTKDK